MTRNVLPQLVRIIFGAEEREMEPYVPHAVGGHR